MTLVKLIQRRQIDMVPKYDEPIGLMNKVKKGVYKKSTGHQYKSNKDNQANTYNTFSICCALILISIRVNIKS